MNMKAIFAAIAVTAAGSASAGDVYPYVDHSKFSGTRTRAEVQAELRAAPPVSARLHEFVEQPAVASARKHDEVRAEVGRGDTEEFSYAASSGSRGATR